MLIKEDINRLGKKELQQACLQLIDQCVEKDKGLEQAESKVQQAESKIQQAESKVRQTESKIQKLIQDYDNLRYQFQLLLCQLYAPKSEKLNKAELQQFDEADLTEEEKKVVEAAEEEIQIAEHTRKVKRKHGTRKPLPENLPRNDILHDLPENERLCTGCGRPMPEVDREYSEQLKYVPAQLIVDRHIRIKRACTCGYCIKLASLPKFPIPKSIAAPSLLSHTIISKYCDALPLYRQENIWKRQEIDIPRKTLCNWVIRSGELAEPLINLMRSEILQGMKINADETTVQVMKESERKNTTKSYMFVFIGGKNGTAIVYKYSQTRSSATPSDFLENYQGYLQTDDYAGYNEACRNNQITRLYCWAHARRGFSDIVKAIKTQGKAYVALQYIKCLYKIEEKAKKEGLSPEQIYLLRQKESKPILEEFKIWLDQTKVTTPPKCPLGKAINYTLDNWAELLVYLENGHLDIDNNFAERKIKPFVLGRKNWLFMGSPRGAKIGAIWYSLIETAKANGLNPFAYINHILIKLPYCKTDEQRIKLLPWNCSLLDITTTLSEKRLE